MFKLMSMSLVVCTNGIVLSPYPLPSRPLLICAVCRELCHLPHADLLTNNNRHQCHKAVKLDIGVGAGPGLS